MRISLAEESTFSNTSLGSFTFLQLYPDSKVHGANMRPIWVRQDPGGPHVGPMHLALWLVTKHQNICGVEKSKGDLWRSTFCYVITTDPDDFCINMARYDYDFI